MFRILLLVVLVVVLLSYGSAWACGQKIHRVYVLPSGVTTGNVMYDGYILEAAKKYDLDPLLLYSQMHQESVFKPNARSHKGAAGLMQLMRSTARRMGVTDIYDPRQNIMGGAKYLRYLLDLYKGNRTLALAGYNAGEGAVKKHGGRVPPYRETKKYVQKINLTYERLRSTPLRS